METVQFTCGHCGKVMAVAAGDLGAQVHCPHCQQVVQAQASPGALEPQPGPAFTTTPVKTEEESIFSPPEESGDDLFGAPAGPRLELPPEPKPAATVLPSWLAPEPGPPLQAEAQAAGGLFADAPEAAAATTSFPEQPAPAEEGLTPSPPARSQLHRSQLGTMVLIFLIPYSVVITLAFGYVLYLNRSYKETDPLERLPDPNPKDGGAERVPNKRVSHDLPLSDKLKTALNQPLKIGDLIVKPLEVTINPDGDLVLALHLQNTSTDTRFNPFPDSFSRFRKGLDLPYTFLQVGQERIYGGFTEWSKKDPRLGPGEEMTAKLIVSGQLPEERTRIDRVRRSQDQLLWRVHVRRGFSEVAGKTISTTAVIGVRFTGADVKDLRKEPAEEAQNGDWLRVFEVPVPILG
jgi:phage FluMu protein Com